MHWWIGRVQSWSYAAINQRVAVGRQQAPSRNHRADPTDSVGDGLAKADPVGLANHKWRLTAEGACRCRLSIESGTDELLTQRP